MTRHSNIAVVFQCLRTLQFTDQDTINLSKKKKTTRIFTKKKSNILNHLNCVFIFSQGIVQLPTHSNAARFILQFDNYYSCLHLTETFFLVDISSGAGCNARFCISTVFSSTATDCIKKKITILSLKKEKGEAFTDATLSEDPRKKKSVITYTAG